MLDKFKTLLSDNKDVKEEEFEASQLAAQGKLSAKPCNTRDDDPPLE